MDGTERTAEALRTLPAGGRAHFWFEAGAAAPLLLTTLVEDPLGDGLRASIRPTAGGATSGVVHSGEDGTLTFVGPGLDASFLRALGAYASQVVGRHPSFSRLRDARACRAYGRAVIETVSDPGAWAGLPQPPAADGTTGAAAEALAALGAGSDAWFWLAGRGPGGRAHLEVAPLAPDPRGVVFARRIRALWARVDRERAKEVRGVARRLGSGRLVFMTEGEAPLLRPFLAVLVAESGSAYPAIAALRSAVHGRLDAPTSPALGFDPEALSAEFVEIPAEGRGSFWLTDAAVHGGPQLVLAEAEDRVKAGSRVAGGTGRTWSGEFRADKGAPLAVTATGGDPDALLATLVSWLAGSHGLPATRTASLAGARVRVVDADGERRADPRAWES